MTTETIEKAKKKKVPGMPNDALLKSAELCEVNARFSWAKDEYDRDVVQLLFPDTGWLLQAPNNTWLIAHLIDAINAKNSAIEELESHIEQLEDK
jgi:hypothetical protein